MDKVSCYLLTPRLGEPNLRDVRTRSHWLFMVRLADDRGEELASTCGTDCWVDCEPESVA